MNEKYLFRAKRLDNGEWVQGYLCPPTYPDFTGTHWHIAEEIDSKFGINGKTWIYETINLSTIGQSTGLHDKNGKLIFEGDILIFTKNPNISPQVVIFHNAEYMLQGIKPRRIISLKKYIEFNEIIGNIYDNPGLLDIGGAKWD